MKEFQKEMLRVWKSSWESYVKSLTMLQDQGDKMLDLLFTQSETMQEESKKLLKEWRANTKEAQKSYIQSVEQNLQKIEELLGKE